METSQSLITGTSTCPTDEPVGVVVMVLGSLIAIGVLIVNSIATPLLLGLLGPLSDTSRSARANDISTMSSMGPGGPMTPGEPFSAILGLLFVLALLFGVAIFLIGFGIRKGRPKAFYWAIVLFSLLLVAGSGWSAIGLCLVVYSGLRLLGVIPNKAIDKNLPKQNTGME